MSKVKTNLLKPLFEFFGEPDWDANGKNPMVIQRHWDESFRSYDERRLQEAADVYIRGKKKTFPSIGDIFEIIDSTPEMKTEKRLVDVSLVADYSAFCSWYNKVMGREDEESPFQALLLAEKEDILNDVVSSFSRFNKIDCDWRSQCCLAWQKGFLPGEAEKKMEELSKGKKQNALEYLAGIVKRGPKNPFQKVILECAPEDTLREARGLSNGTS